MIEPTTCRILASAWVVALFSPPAPSYAAEPEFEVWVVVESRTYQREELFAVSPSVGMPAFPVRVSINSLTIALEGVRITGEWEEHRSRAQISDFPPGANVQAATRGRQLLLKHPGGGVVMARIVRQPKPKKQANDGARD